MDKNHCVPWVTWIGKFFKINIGNTGKTNHNT